MNVIHAEMVHSEKTLTRLALTRYNSFQYGRKLLRFLLAMALVLYGLYGDKHLIMPYFSLAAGCLLAANLDARPKAQARQVAAQMKGRFPHSFYSFSQTGFRYYKDGDEISYKKLIRLVEDREYLYLYVSPESAYMVDKSTVSGGEATLKALLAEKSGLKWTRPFNLLTFRLHSLQREKDERLPPRHL